MNGTTSTSAATGHGGHFDPRQAAALLDQTTRQTRRRIEPYPAWLYVIRAFIALAGYGAVWLSVRGQHPYHHPTAAVIPVLVVLVVVNFVATVTVARRATAYLRAIRWANRRPSRSSSGRSRRSPPAP